MTTLQIRIDAQTKKKAKETLANLGLDISSGIKLFLEQVINTQSVPFVPITIQGLKLRHWDEYKKEIEWAVKYGKRYKTAEEMHADILK